MDKCEGLLYLATGAAVAGAVYHSCSSKSMLPWQGNPTECSARRAAVSARAAEVVPIGPVGEMDGVNVWKEASPLSEGFEGQFEGVKAPTATTTKKDTGTQLVGLDDNERPIARSKIAGLTAGTNALRDYCQPVAATQLNPHSVTMFNQVDF